MVVRWTAAWNGQLSTPEVQWPTPVMVTPAKASGGFVLAWLEHDDPPTQCPSNDRYDEPLSRMRHRLNAARVPPR